MRKSNDAREWKGQETRIWNAETLQSVDSASNIGYFINSSIDDKAVKQDPPSPFYTRDKVVGRLLRKVLSDIIPW